MNRQLIGDESWMPCGVVESPNDWDLFEPRKKPLEETNGMKKRKREGASPDSVERGGAAVTDHADGRGEMAETMAQKEHGRPSSPSLTGPASAEPDQDIAMPDAEHSHDADRRKVSKKKKRGKAPEAEETQSDRENVQMNGAADAAPRVEANGTQAPITAKADMQPLEDGERATMATEENLNEETVEENGMEDSPKPVSEPDDATPMLPTRRITRALAANNTSNPHSNNPTPPLSPTPTLTSSSTSSLLQIDPLFLLPLSVHPSNAPMAFFGLPGDEAAETRRLLTTYIQKQEESVRGYEAVLAKLLKAQRLRDEVLEMCKAEGHVGEMSDGEDWIDYERWGLQPGELRKGRDEDEDAVEENTIGGRKGKRRARN